MHFQSLRLSGFKSFIEKTELDIGPGLTGIVGPNGCGKSNLVEAMRWVMGESSAKRMRGGGMEDVIFAGTERRPRRNFAEVSLVLNNQDRSAPATYNTADEIEVIRKIVRDQGSAYRINGKAVRARDVQLLFSDTLSGANSPSIVSQGRVANLINAKPLDRRIILEESAGISGLYARRHEAELRLKQAEQNLTRLEDISGSLETRLYNLKRQARQALKYKALSAEIRQLDQLIAYLEWKAGEERLQSLEKEYQGFEENVAAQLLTVTQLNTTYLTQSKDLPVLRENKARASAALQAGKLNLERMEEKAKQHQTTLSETKAMLEQVSADLEHSRNSLTEYVETQKRIDEEEQKIHSEEKHSGTLLETRQATLAECEENVSRIEEAYNQLMSDTAALQAQKTSLESQIRQEEDQLHRIEHRIETQNARQNDLATQKSELPDISNAQEQITSLKEMIKTSETKIEKSTEEIKSILSQKEELLDSKQETKLKKLEFESEINSLNEFIDNFSEEEFEPVLKIIKIKKGYETALARGLGDALQASLDQAASAFWNTKTNTDLDSKKHSLPDGVERIEDYVTVPKELKTAITQIGIVSSREDGDRLQSKLNYGQSLVSKDGFYWRWDGLCMTSAATDTQSVFLRQRNKRDELSAQLPKLEKELESKTAELEKIEASLTQQQDTLTTEKETLSTAQKELQTQERELLSIELKHESISKDEENILQMKKELESDRASLTTSLKNHRDLFEKLNSAETQERTNTLDELKEQLVAAREELQNAISALERLQQVQNSRKARLHAIADQRVTLQNRIIRSQDHLKSQEERKTQITDKLKELESLPAEEFADTSKLLSMISDLETKHAEAADILAEKEEECTQTAAALKEAEQSLSSYREERARAQALFSSSKEQQEVLVHKIQEKFEVTPPQLYQNLEKTHEVTTEELPKLEENRQRLVRERESIGAVNLQAETEAQELEQELGGMLHEKNDLIAAVEELRGGIKKLNDEARERLQVTFTHVDAHFQNLFKRLFIGGNAYLKLIESDDPLEAGLEIYAQPPGKAVQALSLMSGGEQTLTSIALIFAMFLTNPAPICVLDEIDAPLDDANVDKVCDLLEEIAEMTKTRFLIVTHHRLTMARMHRIYGVTMAEKGVSQLISLDMQQSFAFLEEAA